MLWFVTEAFTCVTFARTCCIAGSAKWSTGWAISFVICIASILGSKHGQHLNAVQQAFDWLQKSSRNTCYICNIKDQPKKLVIQNTSSQSTTYVWPMYDSVWTVSDIVKQKCGSESHSPASQSPAPAMLQVLQWEVQAPHPVPFLPNLNAHTTRKTL